MEMPEPDAEVIARRDTIIAALSGMVSPGNVIVEKDELRAFECDGLSAYRQIPMIVVLPETTPEVSQILKYCHEKGIKVVPRGAGTGLSGGALPLADGVTLGLGKFNRILDVD
ncbi:MAG: FAD-binding protein, partial [Rhodospirillales bacterium]|nr:FAD-binding protein [Rhodospirillales bacterium]